jgi:hypothetical protein
MRVLICGDRNWQHYLVIETFVAGLYSQYGNQLHLIEGEAKGADKMAAEAAGLYLPDENIHRFPADWNKFHRAAGPIRNREMLMQEPDLVFAFHSDIANSKGTKNMVDIAKDKEVPTYVVSRY